MFLTLLQLVSEDLPAPDRAESEVFSCCEDGSDDPIETLHSVFSHPLARVSILHIPVMRRGEGRGGKENSQDYV